jgi:hypothetical protein
MELESPSLINREADVKCLQIFLALEFPCRFIAETNPNVYRNPEKIQMFKDIRNVSGSCT